jgi:hypothetical protein
MRWETRDWVGVMIGMACGLSAWMNFGSHPVLVFCMGFFGAWVGRQLMP